MRIYQQAMSVIIKAFSIHKRLLSVKYECNIFLDEWFGWPNTFPLFQVFAVPCELNMDDIREYVTAQHGGRETSAEDDIEISFDDVGLSSGILTEFYWEAWYLASPLHNKKPG